jgi:hypothetical protein
MPTIRNSEQARRLAEARWRKHREREAEEAAEAGADGAFAILTKGEQHRLIGAALRQGASAALAEAVPSIALACAELEVNRATAERIADLAMLLTATAIQAAGGPEVVMPAPEAWRQTVNWDAIYASDGKSLVTGAIARESAAEMAEAGGGSPAG